MTGGNVRVRKYRVTLELELYAETAGRAYDRALGLVLRMIDRHVAMRVGQALDLVEKLPNGGIEGEPHGESLDGWRCTYTVDEVRI
jgi:hypothetical protein